MALNSTALTGGTAPEVARALSEDAAAGRSDDSRRRGARAPRRPFGVWFRQTGWRHLIGIVMLVFCSFPLLYVLSAALNPGGTLLTANGLFQTFSVESFTRLFENPTQPFAAWFVNSMVIGRASCRERVYDDV